VKTQRSIQFVDHRLFLSRVFPKKLLKFCHLPSLTLISGPAFTHT
jgi:hypothetical protein